MSNYSNTKATIAANVYTNHNNEVTAAMVKTGINAVVDALIAGGFLYKGVATTSTNPGSPDANVFYIATAPGTYTNFGSLVVNDGELAILKYNGSWSKEVTGAATAAEVSALGHKVDALALGKFYGFYTTSGDLPAGDEVGFAYVGASSPFAIYNFDGNTWSDSGSVYTYPLGNEEDIDLDENGKLQFANRDTTSGMGYIIMRKDDTFANQLTDSDTIYEIRYDFDLGGASVTIPSGSILRFNGGTITNGTLTGTLLNDYILPEWFGAKADGLTDDSNAFINALTLAQSAGCPVVLRAKNYAIQEAVNIALDDGVKIVGNGATFTISSNGVFDFSKASFGTATLSADLARLSTRCTLTSSPSGLAKGDFLVFTSTDVGESSYSTKRMMLTRVGDISGTTIYLTDETILDFAAATTTLTFYHPSKVDISNIALVCNRGGSLHHLRCGFTDVNLSQITITGVSASYGIVLNGCTGAARDTISEIVTYGYLVNTCSHIEFHKISVPKKMRHPVTIAAFSNYVEVTDLSGIGALIESHVAFNVTYRRCVFTCNPSETWTLRAVGATLEDCAVHSATGASVQPIYLCSVALYDTDIYFDYALRIHRCSFDMDYVQVYRSGIVDISDCKFLPSTLIRLGSSGSPQILKTYVRRCENVAIVEPWRDTYTIETDMNRCDAVLDNGTYIISTQAASRWMENKIGGAKVYGIILPVNVGSSITLPIKLFPSSGRASVSQSTRTFIRMKVRVTASNAAGHADKEFLVESVFNTNGNSILYPTVTDLNENETRITLSASNWVSGGTAISANPSEQYVTFDLAIATTIPSASLARIGVTYEAEFNGQNW